MKLLIHIAFWLAYWFIYAYTYSRYDGNFMKYALSEGIQMPTRMLSTYVALWIVEKAMGKTNSWVAFSGVALANIGGGMLNRLIKGWWIVPALFPDASYHYWDFTRMLVDIFDCVLASGAALTARLYFRQQDALQRESALQAEKLRLELQALKNQVNPHFLFNTINNLYGLARVRSEKTAPFALKLAGLLRYVLYDAAKPQVSLEQEIQHLRAYVALEQLRFDADRLEVSFSSEVDNPAFSLSPLLLLPPVENAFKHGAGEAREGAWIHIFISLKNNVLEMQVKNSKPESALPPSSDGLGLANLSRQLELLYPGRHQFEVSETALQFKVHLVING